MKAQKYLHFLDLHFSESRKLLLICSFLVTKTDIVMQMSKICNNFGIKMTKKDNKDGYQNI